MKKFHITASGDVRPCNATKKACRYADSSHYESRKDAQNAYELAQENSLPEKVTRTPEKTTRPEVSGIDSAPIKYEFEVNDEFVQHAERHVAKVNKKLARHGFQNFFKITVDRYTRQTNEGLVAKALIKVTGEQVRIKGKKILASVDHLPEGATVVRTHGEFELDGFRPESQYCDHCGTNRSRTKTFLVEDENGKKLQIGSSCIEAYTGIKPSVASLLFENSLKEDIEEESMNFKDVPVLDPDTFIARALAIKEKYGYVSSKDYDNYSSKDRLLDTMYIPRDPDLAESAQKIKDRADKLLKSKKEIKDFKKYISEMDNSDYGANIKAIAGSEYVRQNHVGLFVSAIARYDFGFHKKSDGPKPWTPGFIADVGTKVKDMEFTVESVRKHDTWDDYTRREVTRTMIVLRDANDKQAIWWTNSKVDFEIDKKVKATSGSVKNHSNFNNADQTVLTRLKLIEIEEDAVDEN